MPISILIVDDSPTVRAAIIRALPLGLDASIEEASDGAAALELCAANLPTVVFLDLAMPVLDGYGVLRVFSCMARRPKIVLVSSDVSDRARGEFLALGADDVVNKPWAPGEIGRVLRRIGVA